jgi:GNAT superfamily N-acetyltransferase
MHKAGSICVHLPGSLIFAGLTCKVIGMIYLQSGGVAVFEIRPIDIEDSALVNHFLLKQWYATEMILRGERVDLSAAPGFIAWEKDEMIGLVTIRISAGECEILSLDSLRENKGVGTALIEKAVDAARTAGCQKVKLITTNDNIRALRFYQKRGFDMACIHHNAMDVSRKLKPAIPLIGMDGIPLKHEIEFEMDLS